MLRLRPYKISDSQYILNWFNDELSFIKWCAGKFKYPLTKEQLNEYYYSCEKDEYAWLMTALNEEGIPIGHFLMRMADYQKESIHLGFIIIDSQIQGNGCGKEMVSSAIRYAFDILKVRRVTLNVFDNNLPAYYCYKAVGFLHEKYNEGNFSYGNKIWGTYEMAIEK